MRRWILEALANSEMRAEEVDDLIINVYTDGASRNNPGNSASGYAIYDSENKLIFRHVFYNGIKTNNEAEYLAIIAALGKVVELCGYSNELRLFSDSQLVVRQIEKKYKTKSKSLAELKSKVDGYAKGFSSFSAKSVPREDPNIVAVDAELNKLLDDMKTDGTAKL